MGVRLENQEYNVLFTLQVKGIIGQGAEAPSGHNRAREGAIRAALAVRIALPAPEAPTALRELSQGVSGTFQGGQWGPFGGSWGSGEAQGTEKYHFLTSCWYHFATKMCSETEMENNTKIKTIFQELLMALRCNNVTIHNKYRCLLKGTLSTES